MNSHLLTVLAEREGIHWILAILLLIRDCCSTQFNRSRKCRGLIQTTRYLEYSHLFLNTGIVSVSASPPLYEGFYLILISTMLVITFDPLVMSRILLLFKLLETSILHHFMKMHPLRFSHSGVLQTQEIQTETLSHLVFNTRLMVKFY